MPPASPPSGRKSLPFIPAYAELQTTTNFSFLRGGSHGEELVATAKTLGLAGLAITDRNTLAGVVRAHAAAKETGMRLVVGARLDLAGLLDAANDQGSSSGAGTAPPSLLCLPTSRPAYGRLSQLLTLGQRRAGKGRCTLFLDDLSRHSSGQILIVLPPDDWDWRAAAAGGLADTGRFTTAAALSRYLDTVRDHMAADARLYLAASHIYRGNDRARIDALARLASRCGVPLVATGDVLYHAPHRRQLQDVLTCIREKCTLADAGLLLQANAERHLKSPVEMARLFAGHEDALSRTVEIMDSCRFSLDELVYEYPDEPVPAGATPQSHLEALTWAGAAERYPDGLSVKIRDVLSKELGIIAQLAYAPYFLTVHDIVRYARSLGILCQGRGSAANSAVCYCLGITSVNPIEVDLLFERFITPERKEPPDIDVDFEHERREEVIQYIYRRYGRERAGLAATVISYRSRSAVREVGKVLGLSQDTVAALAGMVWGSHSGGTLPERHVREAGLDPGDPRLARVLELTRELTGFPRHLSQHVGGFVLTRSPLSQVVPIGNAAMADRTCIEWDKDDLDSVGLLKVDVLGLGMLTCIRRAFALLALHHRRPLTLATVPREDPATYDMLCRADSIGVFQVESRAQMNMLPRLKPRNFYDLVIEVAIVRPGPIQGDMVHPYLRRRDGLEPEHYPSPDPRFGPQDELRQILGKTKGVPLFQEQAMRIAMAAAEFSPEEVNQLRKALATFRRRGTIGKLEEKMVNRMVARGYERAFAERCFNQIKGFGEYGFPESHAASFAHLVYVSAWLKCHHPDVFAAALLNSQPMGFYAPAQIVRDACEHGVEARAADINHSDWDCTLEPTAAQRRHPFALRLGLRQIDGLRQDEAERIMAARRAPAVATRSRGPNADHGFRSVQDLWARAGVQQATLERLAAADAFRSLGIDRRQALWEVKALGTAQPLPLFDRRIDAFRQALAPSPGQTGALTFDSPASPQSPSANALATRHRPGTSREPASTDQAVPSDASEMAGSVSGLSEYAPEEPVVLPAMGLSEHVVADYQTTRLSLKAHPMSFLRTAFAARRVIACAGLKDLKDGARVAVAGIVLVRQRPGSAKGVVFMTIEDETGIANAVIWPKSLERYRKVVMGARVVVIIGRVQRHDTGSGQIIHVVAQRLEDRSDWLSLLSDDGGSMPVSIANADEVLRPEPGSARGTPPETRAGDETERNDQTRRLPVSSPGPATSSRQHPRNVRIIPKSRDFH